MFNFGPLAQLVEQRPFKAWVVGSNPTRLTRCPYRLAWPRTPAFHAGNRGSNPLGDASIIKGLRIVAPLFLLRLLQNRIIFCVFHYYYCIFCIE